MELIRVWYSSGSGSLHIPDIRTDAPRGSSDLLPMASLSGGLGKRASRSSASCQIKIAMIYLAQRVDQLFCLLAQEFLPFALACETVGQVLGHHTTNHRSRAAYEGSSEGRDGLQEFSQNEGPVHSLSTSFWES